MVIFLALFCRKRRLESSASEVSITFLQKFKNILLAEMRVNAMGAKNPVSTVK